LIILLQICDNPERSKKFSEKMAFFSEKSKQWPLAPNLQKWQTTPANVSNASLIFPEMTFGECGQVWRVREKQVGKCRRIY
jgi:hypothetical protein